MTVCSYHVTYAFHSESIFYSCPNVKELLASNMRDIGSLSDSSRIRTHYHWPRPVCLIGWVFVYTLSGCGFESRWCHSSSYFEFILVFSSWLTLTQCFDRNFCDPQYGEPSYCLNSLYNLNLSYYSNLLKVYVRGRIKAFAKRNGSNMCLFDRQETFISRTIFITHMFVKVEKLRLQKKIKLRVTL